MKKKRYLMIAFLLFSPSFFINVEASERGSSSVGIEFYKNPTTPAPKDAPPKTDALAADPKGPAGPPQGDQRSGGSTQTTTTGSKLPRTGSKSQANLSILGLALIGLVGIVHRKKGQHETDQV
ncbi:LPXTG cell wall anchor domain-containing protein [Enterococcus faecalis]|uniref:LPXTG cell wall anchor domain-containing protein n=1 Tax=Enterococcus faecalis TaxID=1351 RepID=UPI00222464E0|nr:LPXTG cell wall anchor domain-containing protein [Enterococcus faecalis]UYY19531.1 LPXTG cell wall anchor domain-containing protein [Enterococcus faecalis]UYY22102.1 LPXTG cell wall anchor domain-containing protein [Enterococcus faecalis]